MSLGYIHPLYNEGPAVSIFDARDDYERRMRESAPARAAAMRANDDAHFAERQAADGFCGWCPELARVGRADGRPLYQPHDLPFPALSAEFEAAAFTSGEFEAWQATRRAEKKRAAEVVAQDAAIAAANPFAALAALKAKA